MAVGYSLSKITHYNTKKKTEVPSLEGLVDNDPQMSTVSEKSGHRKMVGRSVTMVGCHKFNRDGSPRGQHRRFIPTANKTRRRLDPTAGLDVATNANSVHLPRLNLKLPVNDKHKKNDNRKYSVSNNLTGRIMTRFSRMCHEETTYTWKLVYLFNLMGSNLKQHLDKTLQKMENTAGDVSWM